MVDSDTLVLTSVPTPDVPTLTIPTVPGSQIPRLEPRQTAYGPSWDATDELYITYDEEGNRVLTTTGEAGIWAAEYSYQETGSIRYRALRDPGPVGNNAGAASGGERPGWDQSAPTEQAPVHPDRHRHDPRSGSRRRAPGNHQARGDGADGPQRYAWDHSERRGLQERSDRAAQERVRSHRHCPGCSGHDRVYQGGWGLFGRVLGAWFLGWLAIYLSGVGVSLPQYIILTGLGWLALTTIRPAWREWVSAEERHARGWRRTTP